MNYKGLYIEMLERELRYRVLSNPSYSKRAFARDLGIPSSRLTVILQQEEGLSYETAQKMSDKMGWTSEEKSYFCDLVGASCSRSEKKRKLFEEKLRAKSKSNIKRLDTEQFELIAHWYYFGYIQLTRISGFRKNYKWIETRLELKSGQAKELIERLTKMGLINPSTWKATNQRLINSDEIPSQAIRQHFLQINSKAMKAVHEQSIKERQIGTLTVPLPKKILPQVFDKIKNFRMELDDYIAEQARQMDCDSVYCLQTTFFKLIDEKIEGEPK